MDKIESQKTKKKAAIRFSISLIASIIFVCLVSGCGTKSVSRLSQDTGTDIPSVEENKPNPLLQCVPISSDFLSAKASTYYDAFGQLRNEAIRIQISNLTPDFDANRGHYMQFFRWKANSTATALDPNPATIRFESRVIPGQAVSGNYSYIGHAKMIEMANAAKIPGSTVQAILEKVTLVVTGIDFEDDALKAVVYDKDGNVLNETDFLIPAFSIDPNQYADDHGNPRSDVLLQLHPYIASKDDNNETQFYQGLADQSKNCFGAAF